MSNDKLRNEVEARIKSPGGWGEVSDQMRYALARPDRRRGARWCHSCAAVGVRRPMTHMGMSNGLALTSGCEWHIRQWTRGVPW